MLGSLLGLSIGQLAIGHKSPMGSGLSSVPLTGEASEVWRERDPAKGVQRPCQAWNLGPEGRGSVLQPCVRWKLNNLPPEHAIEPPNPDAPSLPLRVPWAGCLPVLRLCKERLNLPETRVLVGMGNRTLRCPGWDHVILATMRGARSPSEGVAQPRASSSGLLVAQDSARKDNTPWSAWYRPSQV